MDGRGKTYFFKITRTEQQIFEQKKLFQDFRFFHALKKSKFIAQSKRILEGVGPNEPPAHPHLVVKTTETYRNCSCECFLQTGNESTVGLAAKMKRNEKIKIVALLASGPTHEKGMYSKS